MKWRLWPGLISAILLALLVAVYFHWITPYLAFALTIALALVNRVTRGRRRPAGDPAGVRPKDWRDQGLL